MHRQVGTAHLCGFADIEKRTANNSVPNYDRGWPHSIIIISEWCCLLPDRRHLEGGMKPAVKMRKG